MDLLAHTLIEHGQEPTNFCIQAIIWNLITLFPTTTLSLVVSSLCLCLDSLW